MTLTLVDTGRASRKSSSRVRQNTPVTAIGIGRTRPAREGSTSTTGSSLPEPEFFRKAPPSKAGFFAVSASKKKRLRLKLVTRCAHCQREHRHGGQAGGGCGDQCQDS